jgi:hypothetical protein
MNFYEQLFSRGRTTGEGMTHFERLFAAKFGGPPPPEVREYTGPVPVTITADGTPLIDCLISGNTTQNGTPTPDSPIMPERCGDETANLSNVSDYTNNNTDTRTYFVLRILMSKNGGQTETFSSPMQGTGENSFTFTLTTEADTMRIVHNGSQRNLFIEELTGEFSGTYTYSFDLESNDPTTIGGLVLNDIMLNTGSTAQSFEPYGYKIPITSTGQTNNIYLGEVETTRRIRKLVFDGTENWRESSDGNIYIALSPNQGVAWVRVLSTHFTSSQVQTNGGLLWFVNSNVDFDTAEECKAYLAQQYANGTPVTVWYVLEEPTTGIVNEPLMKIGDYADTLSKAQAGVAIPTNNGSTTVDVDTTLKPSEVYIKYMG